MLVRTFGRDLNLPSKFFKMSSNYDFVINMRDMGVNVEGRNGRVEYIERASFSMESLKHVEVGQHSGFLCTVSCSLREETK